MTSQSSNDGNKFFINNETGNAGDLCRDVRQKESSIVSIEFFNQGYAA
jgi:hypothetical protein